MKNICPGCGQEIDGRYDDQQLTFVFVQHVHPRRIELPENDNARWCEFSGRPLS